MTFTRYTVAEPVMLEGLGLHSGTPVVVKIHPGNNGIALRKGSERTEAIPENVTDTRLCTCLGSFATIEHLMSALGGLEISDAEIEVSANELPALDGSALSFCEAILAVGRMELGRRSIHGPFSRVFVKKEGSAVAIGTGRGHWRYVFHSKTRFPFDESFETADVIQDYVGSIAPARTFGWEEDLPELEAAGLAKGLTYETAVLLSGEGSLTPLRFQDETTRHKLLDAIGDVYLAGAPIRALNVHAEQAGHRMNIEAAVKLRAAIRFEDVE